ncbi:chemotaxis-specific protein-glutamate methyltransferase CheB [Sphingomonas sp. LB-2]|uniref:chemotaxis-specific protein-glutamate methyltransferase CheB n=1 Tax=Sphingomonas caeni TaxID=2984949 RepID=UPI00222EA73E|nr:chemotaxis-specific protein-glutamate methyltransferase CheB [Sphingomonas caeni]MCW3846581.1 chemotaxis-specific protein-glutamate methyltransferase CheB [Sphingomonas caeni]
MNPIRVLVVEDSLTVLRRLVEVLGADPGIEVVGEASDGKRAIELAKKLKPDVITLDMMLPVMTGVAVTEYIMAHFPTPILIVSASMNRGELFRTYDALAAGAVDVLEKPRGDEPDGEWEAKLLAAVKLVARIRVITHPRMRMGALGRVADPLAPLPAAASARSDRCEVVAIGASTGGPAAVIDILRALPVHFPLPILLVLHIGEPFGAGFADWLDGQTHHRVRYARDGEALGTRGRVIMAPVERHMVVENGVVRLHGGPERFSCRPSVDVLFESVAREFGNCAAAALLTGMGRDGASGLLDIRRAGGLTFAQDEASSVVYGMPREAAILGAAEKILPLSEIGPALASLAATPRRRTR